jgi:hypothetical protein
MIRNRSHGLGCVEMAIVVSRRLVSLRSQLAAQAILHNG